MQLPSGAQTWLACGFDNAWTLHEYLTAALVDAINVGNWQRGGDPKSPPPEPVRRPADMRRVGVVTERRGAKARAFLERQKRSQTTEPEEA
jgi:hypothetical protein